MNDEVFTISQLNQFIKDVINAGFPQQIWVCGEIQQYDRNKDKRHVFFELVEKNEHSQEILARMGLVIFQGTKPLINSILKDSENAFALKDDIEVKFLCRVDFYPPHGAVRLIVESIDPYYTLGKLAQEKQKLIAELKKRGVLDENKKLMLPMVPLNIGLISSHDSAAYNDFISELQRSRFSFNVYFRNALMQGKSAEQDIVNNIDVITKTCDLDVLVITRGGGSLADLSSFDSRLIAEKIASLNVPVLTGIGHEINLTITDMAAHTYAKTPTAIAQFIIEEVNQYVLSINSLLERVLDQAMVQIERAFQKIKDTTYNLHHSTTSYLKEHNELMVCFKESLKNKPTMLIDRAERILEQNKEDLVRATYANIKQSTVNLENYAKIIDIVHPKNTLKRGFSVTRLKDGQAVKSVKQTSKKDRIVTEVYDGQIESEISSIRK